MNQQEVNNAAHEIDSWLQDAVGDLAYGYSGWDDIESNFGDKPKWKRRIKQAKAWPVKDINGWLADELYNDWETLSDLIGDRIFDEGKGSEENMIRIAEEMIELGAHHDLARACRHHIKAWKRRIRERRKKG